MRSGGFLPGLWLIMESKDGSWLRGWYLDHPAVSCPRGLSHLCFWWILPNISFDGNFYSWCPAAYSHNNICQTRKYINSSLSTYNKLNRCYHFLSSSHFRDKSWGKHVSRSCHWVKTGSAKLSHELRPGQSSLYKVSERYWFHPTSI